MKIKVCYNNDMRIWRYPDNNHYLSIIKFIKKSFNLSDEDKFYLQYNDDEVLFYLYFVFIYGIYSINIQG